MIEIKENVSIVLAKTEDALLDEFFNENLEFRKIRRKE